MKAKLYDQVGRELGEVELADAVFGAERRPDLVHLCVLAQLAAKRAGTAQAKTRGEVVGSGKKPFRQKGTGHARQGSTRSVQQRGGGVAFAPIPRDYTQRIPRKVRRAAFASAVSDKLAESRLRVLDRVVIDEYRTQAVVEILADHKLLADKVLFIVNAKNEKFYKSAANISTVTIRHAGNASILEVVDADSILITKDAAERLARERI